MWRGVEPIEGYLVGCRPNDCAMRCAATVKTSRNRTTVCCIGPQVNESIVDLDGCRPQVPPVGLVSVLLRQLKVMQSLYKPFVRLAVFTVTLIALSLLAASAVMSTPSVNQPLIVGSEQDYPPFAIGTTDKTADGFTVELWKEVAKSQGLAYEIRVRPFDDILQGLKSGAVDVLLNLAQSDERRLFADFSVSHVTVNGAIFARNSEDRIHAESDLAGKSIVVIRGDLAQNYAVSKGWEHQLILVDTAQQGLRELASGKHDAMLLSQLVGEQTIRNKLLSGVKALDVKVGFSQRFSFAVRKGNTALLAHINEGLSLTWSNGVNERLHEKWFGVYETKPRTLLDAWPELTAIVVVVMTAWVVTYYRRRQRDRWTAVTLRDSEDRWKFALDGAGEGVWESNLVAGTTLYSTRWKEMLGYADNEIGNDPNELSKRIHPDDLAPVLADRQLCVDGVTNSFVSEFRMRSKAGQWIWILARGKVIGRGVDGKVLRLMGTHTDISDRKSRQARDAGYAAVMTLLAANVSLSVILASIVHRIESSGNWYCGLLLTDVTSTQLLTGTTSFSQQAAYKLGVEGVEGASGLNAVKQIDQVDETDRALQADPGWDAYGNLAEQAMLRECGSHSIVGSAGAVLGRLAVYLSRPGELTSAEKAVLADAAQITTLAIERKRDEQDLRNSEERLQLALKASRLAL